MRIGIALSGGGARGVAHIGVLKALDELGVKFACIAGTSAGSIVGALYAGGHSPDRILEIIKQVTVFKSVRPAWTWSGLLTMSGMRDILLKHLPENDFAALKIPLTVTATELRLGETHYFSEGQLIPAVMASCTVPGMFSPVIIKDGLYVDGGVFDNLPARILRNKCDILVGSHCNQMPKEFDPKNMKLVVERTLLMTVSANTQIGKGFCDVVIEPPGIGRYASFDIAKAQEIFDFAYKFTKENFNIHNFERTNA